MTCAGILAVPQGGMSAPRAGLGAACSFHLFEEFLEVHVGIPQRTFESITVNFVVKRKHYPSSIRMFHLDMAAPAMDLMESKTLECRHDFSAGEQWQLHSDS